MSQFHNSRDNEAPDAPPPTTNVQTTPRFIRLEDGSLLNMDSVSRILMLKTESGTAQVIAVLKGTDEYCHIYHDVTRQSAEDAMEKLATALGCSDESGFDFRLYFGGEDDE